MHGFVSCTVINSGVFDEVNRKALATGLCYFLQEPISASDLKYLWQLVYHSRAYSAQNAGFQSMVPHVKGLQNTQMKQVHIIKLQGCLNSTACHISILNSLG